MNTLENQKIAIQIQGMTCQACAARIERVLNKNPSVQQATVNFATEQAQVVFNDGELSSEEILALVQKAGFHGEIRQAGQLQPLEAARIGVRHWALALITLPFLIGMAGMLFGSHALMIPAWLQLILAGIVQVWLALPFYRSAWASLRNGTANMDVLVSLGTTAIYLYSAAMLFFSPTHHGTAHVYFEASVMIIAFVTLGKLLEERTKKHSLNSLASLLQLTPSQVFVHKNEKWVSMPLDQVQIGDLLLANQGERIAADGVVEQGDGWCDESHLTGEAIPVAKQQGDRMLAGAMVTDGSLIYRATQLGSQTLLGDMMNALADAQGSKAPIARFADRAAAVFVPAVLLLSALTFFATWAFEGNSVAAVVHAVAVLVIACPCALGLATPAAVMVGMGKAVNHGIWFKDAAALESAAHIDTVVLDKTGTLTTGKPQIAALWQPDDTPYGETDLYRFAAAVEVMTPHPLARAIVEAAQQKTADIPTALSVKTHIGQGVEADIPTVGSVKVGKPDYCGVTLPDDLGEIWQIASVVAVSVNGSPLGAFALADSLKDDALQAVQRLKAQQINVIIMSGDRQPVVDFTARQLGITQAYGNLSPRDKAEQIARLKRSGKTVAMAGDGVNDAPALAAADVSFAMKSGTDIAQQTASATLMRHSVNQLADALFIAKATLKNIKQNFFFAFIYNILGIPLAALGFLSPIIAAAAMAMSSVSVLMNALRLKKAKI